MSSLTKRIVNPVSHGGSARWREDGLSQIDLVRGLIIGFAAGTWMVFCGGCMLISGYSASYTTGYMPFLSEHRRKLRKNCRGWIHHTKMMCIVLAVLYHEIYELILLRCVSVSPGGMDFHLVTRLG